MSSFTRRAFIKASGAAAVILSAGGGCAAGDGPPAGRPSPSGRAAATGAARPSIDRRALVARHNPRVRSIDPFAALSVGNGAFAFTADVTGLQTFPEPYDKPFPLCTTAQWAWHTIPASIAGVNPADFRPQMWETYGRDVPYATSSKGQEPLFNWLRENPHRLHLGRIGLVLNRAGSGAPAATTAATALATPDDIRNIDQTLDLWSGVLTSRFEFDGQAVEVRTAVHPDHDLLAVRVRSPLVRAGRLAVAVAFPYGSSSRQMADWTVPQRHQTRVISATPTRVELERVLDEDRYHVLLAAGAGGHIARDGDHVFRVAADSDQLDLSCLFTRDAAGVAIDFPTVAATHEAAARHWEKFWTTGGALDLAGSTHPQANELERRIVLSQYNTALHCAGSLPSAETGLLCNSWYGKFHLEMHWWHSVHFVAWDRFDLFERSMGYYEKILPQAREIARTQGFGGARWPKMVGPEGRDSPSPVGPLLLWQQPHPIYYAELCYRRRPDRATLQRWEQIVEQSAEFMSYAHRVGDRYVLGPPMKTVSENADTLSTINPTFELAYWRWGLLAAQRWRERLGRGRNAQWDEVLGALSPLPVKDGLYLMQEGMTDTYTKWNWEHPALLMPASLLSRNEYDVGTMRRTLAKVMEVWQWDRAWGWDFGVAGMAAAHVGEPELAVKALLIESVKNRYHPNGHNYQRENLTAYLPGNGALLCAAAAIALKSGFPRDGQWQARHENLAPLL